MATTAAASCRRTAGVDDADRWQGERSELNTLDVHEGLDYAVDINPRRSGTFISGTGQQIVAPEFLSDYQPDVVLVMSPDLSRRDQGFKWTRSVSVRPGS